MLRDSLPPRPEGSIRSIDEIVPSPEAHIAVTDHKATVREQIGTIELEQMAGSFFQNNNSILPSLMEYVASTIYSSSSLPRSALNPGEVRAAADKRYLIDTYCGSGLFALCLADHFDEIEGVEIDKNSVKWAIKNAEFNKGEGRGKVDFIAGNAEAIFSARFFYLFCR